MSMFCYQCQEAAGGKGCTIKGVCGKTDTQSNSMDILLYALKGISYLTVLAKENKLEFESDKVKDLVLDGLFTTITNANFDDKVILDKAKKAFEVRDELKDILKTAGVKLEDLPDAVIWEYKTDEELKAKMNKVGVLATENEDIRSLRELILYGLKGLAAYTEHAKVLGYTKNSIDEFIQKALAATLDDKLGADELTALTLETGKFGVEAMALLDEANTKTYGNPQLLEQTEGTGIDVYTHSEMLPANYYPAFKKYKHFIGNYGNAWWKQNEEFESFNGPILFTTNCIVPPKADAKYKDKIFTTGSSGLAGAKHIEEDENGKKDFSEIIKLAKKCNAPKEIEKGKIVGGFAHNQVMQLADKVVDAVKTGAIKKFFVMAGCDGRMKSRDYYTEFADKLPKDTVILTAGCAKYRYNKLDLGDIGGIPRVLDAGQCNDSYSLAVIALKLKEVFELNDINDLPIAYNIAWYEQKAVIVLLALLSLGVKNIHIGPTLPAFLSPNVVNVLVENFGIAGIGNVDDDIKMFMK